jgi:hypothetical protein
MTSVTRSKTEFDEGQNGKHMHSWLYSATLSSEVSGSSRERENHVTWRGRYCMCLHKQARKKEATAGLWNSEGVIWYTTLFKKYPTLFLGKTSDGITFMRMRDFLPSRLVRLSLLGSYCVRCCNTCSSHCISPNNDWTHGAAVLHQVLPGAKRGIPVVRQAPFSPDMAPCDFWLFPKLKRLLKGSRSDSCGTRQRSWEAFQKCFQQWKER